MSGVSRKPLPKVRIIPCSSPHSFTRTRSLSLSLSLSLSQDIPLTRDADTLYFADISKPCSSAYRAISGVAQFAYFPSLTSVVSTRLAEPCQGKRLQAKHVQAKQWPQEHCETKSECTATAQGCWQRKGGKDCCCLTQEDKEGGIIGG